MTRLVPEEVQVSRTPTERHLLASMIFVAMIAWMRTNCSGRYHNKAECTSKKLTERF